MNLLIRYKPLAFAGLVILALALLDSIKLTADANDDEKIDASTKFGSEKEHQRNKATVDRLIYAHKIEKQARRLPLEDFENYLAEKQVQVEQFKQNLDLPFKLIEEDLLKLQAADTNNNADEIDMKRKQLDSFKTQASVLKSLAFVDHNSCNFNQLNTILLPIAMGIGYSVGEKGILDSVAKPLLINALAVCETFIENSFGPLVELATSKPNTLEKLQLIELMNMFEIHNGFATKQINYSRWPKIFRTLNHDNPNGFLASIAIKLKTFSDKLLLSRENFNTMYHHMEKMCRKHNEQGLGMYFKLSKAIRTYRPEKSYVDEGDRMMPIQFKGKELLFRETMFRFALCRQILRLNDRKLQSIYKYIREGPPKKRCANQENCQHRRSCICDRGKNGPKGSELSRRAATNTKDKRETKDDQGSKDDENEEDDEDEDEYDEIEDEEDENKSEQGQAIKENDRASEE